MKQQRLFPLNEYPLQLLRIALGQCRDNTPSTAKHCQSEPIAVHKSSTSNLPCLELVVQTGKLDKEFPLLLELRQKLGM